MQNLQNSIKTIIPALAILICLTACNQTSSSDEEQETQVVETPVENPGECFVFQSKKDSAFLHIIRDGDKVTGDLSYNIFEKDRNTGTIEGSVKGDTLFAHYRFMSEGAESVREAVFLKQNGNWHEGFGPVEMKENSAVFKGRSKIEFSNDLVFKPVDCP